MTQKEPEMAAIVAAMHETYMTGGVRETAWLALSLIGEWDEMRDYEAEDVGLLRLGLAACDELELVAIASLLLTHLDRVLRRPAFSLEPDIRRELETYLILHR